MSDGSFITTFVAAWNVSVSSSAAVSVSCARSVGRHCSCQLSGRSQQPHAASLPKHVRDAGGSHRASECRQQRRRRRGLDGDRSRGCAHMAGTGRCFLGRSSAVDPAERLGVGVRTRSPWLEKKRRRFVNWIAHLPVLSNKDRLLRCVPQIPLLFPVYEHTEPSYNPQATGSTHDI